MASGPGEGAHGVVKRYDANGNTKLGTPAKGATLNSGDLYDFENRLIRRSSTLAAQSSAIDVLYDADGNRVKETVGAQTVSFLVDPENPTGYAQVVEERVNGTLVRTYTYGHALLSQTQAGLPAWVTTYYSADGHGSTRLLTDSAGAITDTYAYEAFGTQLSHTSTNAQPTFNRYRYTGEQFDEDLGLYFLRARYLNPDSGRFWSMDSYEGGKSDPRSLHKYLYANANPVMGRDPSGYMELVELEAAETADATQNTSAVPVARTALEVTSNSTVNIPLTIGVNSFLAIIAYDILKEGSRRDCAIIGETTDRVVSAAALFRAAGWAPEIFWWDDDTEAALRSIGVTYDSIALEKLNETWIFRVMDNKMILFDLGLDENRSRDNPGRFYELEDMLTAKYSLKRKTAYPGSLRYLNK
jgi:RHS repeat-associated protein